MKPKIINVSLNRKLNNLSYPIFVGNNLLPNSKSIIKQFVNNRKVVLIHDKFFSEEIKNNHNFVDFVKTIKNLSKSVNLIGIPGGDKTKNISQLNFILEKSLSFEISRDSLIIAFGGGVVGDIAGFASMSSSECEADALLQLVSYR